MPGMEGYGGGGAGVEILVKRKIFLTPLGKEKHDLSVTRLTDIIIIIIIMFMKV